MKRLNEYSLQVGDIILTTASAAISKAIRMATRSDISHAMICVDDRSVIDSTNEGVQARNTQRLLFEDDCVIHALRLRDDLSEEQASGICTFARAKVGTQYSTREAIQTVLGGGQDGTKKQFCSRLVAQAYNSVGISLVKNPNFCSPENLKESSFLFAVSKPTVAITAEEAACWDELVDIPLIMRTATNLVLNGARKRDPNIQTFDDLNQRIINHPEDDSYICDLLKTSGYLTVWKTEKEKNPWQYDLTLMGKSEGNNQEIEKYCWSTLVNEEHGPNRYLVNRGGYMLLSKQSGRQYFAIMTELYSLLATLHERRVDVATKWLEARGLLVPSAKQGLTPHTPEWFTALETWNPVQAKMARITIEAAGQVDVCSICGDDPANDYRLAEELRPPGGADTLRLCDDCLEIRGKSGDHFVSI